MLHKTVIDKSCPIVRLSFLPIKIIINKVLLFTFKVNVISAIETKNLFTTYDTLSLLIKISINNFFF